MSEQMEFVRHAFIIRHLAVDDTSRGALGYGKGATLYVYYPPSHCWP